MGEGRLRVEVVFLQGFGEELEDVIFSHVTTVTIQGICITLLHFACAPIFYRRYLR